MSKVEVLVLTSMGQWSSGLVVQKVGQKDVQVVLWKKMHENAVEPGTCWGGPCKNV